jgi:hypothetical protein
MWNSSGLQAADNGQQKIKGLQPRASHSLRLPDFFVKGTDSAVPKSSTPKAALQAAEKVLEFAAGLKYEGSCAETIWGR